MMVIQMKLNGGMRGMSTHEPEPPSVTIVKLWDTGKSFKAILEFTRSPADEVRKVLEQAERLKPVKQDFDWTDEAVERLKILDADGQSASKIARQIGGGLTRNAVIGKISRLNLRASRPARKPVQPRVNNPVHRSTKSRPMPPPPAPAADYPGPLKIGDDEFITLETLTDRMCHFPFGDPREPGFHYCGLEPDGGPYCAHHARGAGGVYDTKATKRYEDAVRARKAEVQR